MIVLHQAKPEEGDRTPITKDQILVAYGRYAAQIDSFPILPQHGFGASSKYGDWFIYNDLELCEKFIGKFSTINIQTHDGIIKLQTKAVDLSKQSVSNKLSDGLMRILTAHVIINVPNGSIFRLLNIDMLRKAFAKFDLLTLKSSRDGVKIDGKRVKVAGCDGNNYHLNVRPFNGHLLATYFPPTIQVYFPSLDKHISFEYRIFEHPELSGKICLDSCHRYFESYMPYLPMDFVSANNPIPCICDKIKGRSRPGPSFDRSTSGLDALMGAIANRKADKAADPCKHFTSGRCYATGKGARCAFLHASEPHVIDCHLGGKCTAKCLYKHAEMKVSSPAHISCDEYLLTTCPPD